MPKYFFHLAGQLPAHDLLGHECATDKEAEDHGSFIAHRIGTESQVDRICAAIEIDCHYCDVVVERFERFTGDEARHAMTGRSFSEERSVRTAKICADLPSREQAS
jgi:hypothetical protein